MAKEKILKTNAARLLDKAGIAYDLVPYPVDEEHLDAGHIAEVLDEDINRVFKTLVLRGERKGHFVCVIPGNMEVDLKKAAKAFGDKKAEMIHVKELLPLTGYIRGGCSPVGMKKPLPTFFHESVGNFDAIFVSAGQRGLQLHINPKDLIEYTGSTVADIAVPMES
ncbi:MAG: Cys-tRNA(Pro) deacylase [Duncaniella sp.]|nr:Cys-tRNA(Pro) deacylase [Duncaniella sp.]